MIRSTHSSGTVRDIPGAKRHRILLSSSPFKGSSILRGDIAYRAEKIDDIEGITGSTPVSPTIFPRLFPSHRTRGIGLKSETG
jgi:hypothetical protein